VILFRCLAWDARAAAAAPGGALWFPRQLQGQGRHDRPERFGCLYVSEDPVSAVAEQVAPLAGTRLEPSDLTRAGLPLALAALRLSESARILDLDEPLVLAGEGLRPSLVATRERPRSQALAALLHERHPDAAGLRWWSALEPRWANVTLFDRAAGELAVEDVRALALTDEVVGEAAAFLGLTTAA
jgi:RES domain